MQRYFLNQQMPEHRSTEIVLKDDQYHHIVRVMRMKEKDQVVLVLPDHLAFKAEIIQVLEEEVHLKWIADETQSKELPVQVTIASGLPKGDKLEWIVQKGTELGANAFIPFKSEYAIVKWDQKKAAKKQERLSKIAQEASEQAHRTKVPEIKSVATFNEVLQQSAEYDFCLVAYEENAKNGEMQNFRSVMNRLKSGHKVLIVFGPEGGLSPSEISQLEERSFTVCSLGPRILRTETAPLYALSAISFATELNGF
ncbi:16S rRNA (uracil(1498)-N(3))-methyltransferase [Desemzia sp. RIT804]|uniref:16S rRNA (uracil(1498)-N(3))-methyltransferase n=1 Tax=Desemzia sp. RIT 804 TaxID=2810209 RepID=UPI0019526149|nr:16S rRNA (uracil(1498)-N(3))-methyltransferase [Desemzia sp. RIT 804]